MSDDWDDDANPWIVRAARRPWENGWFAIDDYDVTNPAGKPGSYAVIRVRRLAVGVLPIEPDGTVHLVGQWRFPLERYSWEMPEGGAELDESPLVCAERELAEETGLTAGALKEVLRMDMSNSLTDEQAFVYLATDLTPGVARPEDTEVLKHRTAHFRELLERVCDGRIRDSLTVAAVLRAHHMAVTGELPAPLAQAMLG